MARTEAPPAAPAAAPTAQPPPVAPAVDARPSPVLAWPSEWPVPELPEPTRRTRAGRGLPMAPVLTGAGNATAMTATAAYQLGGPLAVAATGAVVVAGTATAAMRRRATVRRSMPRRAATGGATAGWQSSRSGATGGGGATRRSSGGGGSGSGSSRGAGGGSPWRSGPLSSTGATRGGSLLDKGNDTGPKKDRKDGGKHKAPKGPKTDRREKKEKNRRKGAGKNSLKAAAGRALRASTKPGSTPRRAAAAVGHGTAEVWRATAPVRAATARQTKKLRGATRDGLRSILSGAWTWLRTRDRKAAVGRLKDVWRRHRTGRHATPTEPATPTLAATVRRPTTTTATATAGGPAMSGGHHFIAPAMEAARIAANYDPKGMLQVGEDFAGLEEALRLHAEAMKATVENADAKQPLDPRIVEIMRQIHQMQIKAAEMAAELRPAFEKLHDVDLTRLRNPRKGVAGERMWDVSTNLA